MIHVLHSLVAMAATAGVYFLAVGLHSRLGGPALLHPALTSILAMGTGLWALGVAHAEYVAAAWPIHAALIPVTVLLAVPLWRQRSFILGSAGRLAMIVCAGCAVTLLLSAGFAAVTLATPEVVHTLLAKSVTTPVAVGIAENTGGLPELAPAIVISTAIVGACMGPSVCRMLGVDDDRAVGLALGIAAHAIGTARAFQISETAGAYATVGLILNAMLTATGAALFVAFA